jgi:carbamoyl-phosphate synthase small subunit
MSIPTPAVFVLEDGTRFAGRAYGALGRTLGEAVFATGMTGYQETLTDPSYAGQIVLMTAPHIGNTGMNDADEESSRIWVAGFVVRDPSRVVSNFRSQRSLDDDLVEQGIVGISGVDTRAITRRLRDSGAMRAGIFSGTDAELGDDEQLAIVRAGRDMRGLNLSGEVSTSEAYVVAAIGERLGNLAVLDLGVKASTLTYLSQRGFDVHVLPQNVTLAEVLAIEPVGAFYSNGPGDPGASDQHVELLQGILREGLPFFGICFGNQLLGCWSDAPSASAPTNSPSATAASTSPSSTSPPAAPRSPATTTASPSTRRSARSPSRPPASAGSRSATSTSTTTWSKA